MLIKHREFISSLYSERRCRFYKVDFDALQIGNVREISIYKTYTLRCSSSVTSTNLSTPCVQVLFISRTYIHIYNDTYFPFSIILCQRESANIQQLISQRDVLTLQVTQNSEHLISKLSKGKSQIEELCFVIV